MKYKNININIVETYKNLVTKTISIFMKYIKNLNFILTFKCNLKCKHCDIWNNNEQSTIKLDKFKEIINDDVVINSYNHYQEKFELSISGGEVFLIQNLKEYFKLLQDFFPKASICITTNGVLTDRITHFFNNISLKNKFKINISIDGNKYIHDNQRGITGSYNKTIKTIIILKKRFPKLLIEMRFTITILNYKYIDYFTKLANKLGVFFSFKPYENMTNYTNKVQNIDTNINENIIQIIEKQIMNNKFIKKQSHYKTPLFFYKIPQYLRNGLKNKEKNLCNIAKNDLEIMPNLDVFSCILMNKIGNINNDTIENIIKSKELEKQKNNIINGNCPGCMLMCGGAKTKEIFIKNN